MHLTADQTTALVSALVSLLVAGGAWLRARMAHQAAVRADSKATKALNGLAGQAGGSQPGSGTPRASA